MTVTIFLLPSLLGLLFFSVIPIGSSLYLSLTEWDVIGAPPRFIKVDNYLNILQSEEFWRVLKNTSYFIVLYLPLILVSSIVVGSLLNLRYKGIALYRTLFLGAMILFAFTFFINTVAEVMRQRLREKYRAVE